VGESWWGKMGANNGRAGATEQRKANIAYIQRMLAELRHVAYRERADLLCYLIEMAYVEAGDLQKSGRADLSKHGERH
jgi:hypothetical protein